MQKSAAFHKSIDDSWIILSEVCAIISKFAFKNSHYFLALKQCKVQKVYCNAMVRALTVCREIFQCLT